MTLRDITDLSHRFRSQLAKHYKNGFGIMPTADPNEIFYNQVWVRDAVHASLNYYIDEFPESFEDTLVTILRHQQKNGALPSRVEREYLLLKLTPGLRWLAAPAFNLIEHTIRGRKERPVYTGEDFNGARDTVPIILIAAHRYSRSVRGRAFTRDRYEQLRRAYRYFAHEHPLRGGLIELPTSTNDWADSILRGGKLGLINVLWTQSLRAMHELALLYGDNETAKETTSRFAESDAALRDLYELAGYVRASDGDGRIDTVASIIYSLFFLTPEESVDVQELLGKRVRQATGLANFDPPYETKDIYWAFKMIGHGGYHNRYVWPWVTLQNITSKIHIAQTHHDEAVRIKYKEEARRDFSETSQLFIDSDGAYEIYFADARKPAQTLFYKPPRFFLANLATWERVRMQLDLL